MNQVPAYTDSSEKFNTLDLLDQFRNAMPPGDWEVPMYVRLAGLVAAPQGEDIYEAAIGRGGVSVAGGGWRACWGELHLRRS
jgi:hypothetical protein